MSTITSLIVNTADSWWTKILTEIKMFRLDQDVIESSEKKKQKFQK